MVTHIVTKQLHDEGGDTSVDADEDVDAGEDNIGCAGDLEEEGGRVHQGSDGPAGNADMLEMEDTAGMEPPSASGPTRRAAAGG